MWALLLDLFRTPGAEPDAEGWATRFCAHQGLSLLITVVTMAMLGDSAWLASVVIYAAWEVAQFFAAADRSFLLAMDCLADWLAWSLAAVAVACLMDGTVIFSACLMVVSAFMLTVGILTRR